MTPNIPAEVSNPVTIKSWAVSRDTAERISFQVSNKPFCEMVFNFLFENTFLQQWMTHPESWVGLQKLFSWLLESVPLSLALMVPGFSIALFMAGTLTIALLYRFYQLKNRND